MKELFLEFINFEVLFKLTFAAISGIGIGFERELKGKPLGLKTCLIISVMACLLTIVSFEVAFLYSKEYSRPMDPGRIPSYLISGIGFLGAGVILRRRKVKSYFRSSYRIFSSSCSWNWNYDWCWFLYGGSFGNYLFNYWDKNCSAIIQ